MRIGPVGNAAGRAEEVHGDRRLLAQRAIGKHADQRAFLEALAQLEHRVDAAEADDVVRERGIDRGKHRGDIARVLLPHRHRDAPLGEPPGGAQRLEAAEVRAHEEGTRARRRDRRRAPRCRRARSGP
jgi:hypothetical protein